jgi:hypothetical protein
VDRESSDRLGHAFNSSVLFMLGVPAFLLGGLATLIVLNVRARARSEAAAASERDPTKPEG